MSELSKLRWRCRRGMKELDIVLSAYLERHYPTAPAQEQRLFAHLLDLQDPELYAYLIGRQTPEEPALAALIVKLRAAAHS